MRQRADFPFASIHLPSIFRKRQHGVVAEVIARLLFIYAAFFHEVVFTILNDVKVVAGTGPPTAGCRNGTGRNLVRRKFNGANDRAIGDVVHLNFIIA